MSTQEVASAALAGKVEVLGVRPVRNSQACEVLIVDVASTELAKAALTAAGLSVVALERFSSFNFPVIRAVQP